MNPTWLYVGALYALAVWLARRFGVDFRWRIAAFFYLLVLLFLWRPMTQSYVNLPVDFLSGLPPWSFTERIRPQNGEINDVALQMVPWAHEVREQWKSLRFPLWNSHAVSGYPLLANGQSRSRLYSLSRDRPPLILEFREQLPRLVIHEDIEHRE